jgi:Fe-S oxidoreductase
MAGAFGYQAGHYDVSMKMAEAALLPALRKAGADTLIVADGTSCRHQIHDGLQAGQGSPAAQTLRDVQADALHVAQVLARALDTAASR